MVPLSLCLGENVPVIKKFVLKLFYNNNYNFSCAILDNTYRILYNNLNILHTLRQQKLHV